MSSHLLIGRAALGLSRPDLKAHAAYKCRRIRLWSSIVRIFNGLITSSSAAFAKWHK